MSNILSVNTQIDECPICMEKIFSEDKKDEKVLKEKVYLSCSHIFCRSCFDKWWQPDSTLPCHKACPTCRQAIKEVFLIKSLSREEDHIVVKYDKGKNLVPSIASFTSRINLSPPANPIDLIVVRQRNLANAVTSQLNTLQAQLEQPTSIRPVSTIVGSLQKFPDFMDPFFRQCATAGSMNHSPTQELMSICRRLVHDLERICGIAPLSSINSQHVLDLGQIRTTIASTLAQLAPYADQ